MLTEYPRLRKALYTIYSVLGLALGATQVGYATADAGTPTWLKVTIAVFAFLGAGLGFTAATNTVTRLSINADKIIPGSVSVGQMGSLTVVTDPVAEGRRIKAALDAYHAASGERSE